MIICIMQIGIAIALANIACLESRETQPYINHIKELTNPKYTVSTEMHL